MMRLLRHRLRSLRQAPVLIHATHQPGAPLCQGYNWWDDKADQFWLARFIDHYFPTHQRINLFSCFQHPQLFLRFYKGKKIFFSGENLQSAMVHQFDPIYKDHRINEVDLALGFEFRSESNYYRFPLWITQNDFIHPEWTLEEIQAKIKQLNDSSIRLSPGRTKFASQISSHDRGGVRSILLDLLASIGQIDCAGHFRNNTDELKTVYRDHKEEYLRQYRFNLCPENSLGEGYITEKVFDSISAGCIPIYWGEYLEPGILNPEAILRYEKGKEQELYERIRLLWEDEVAYRDFVAIPPFVDGAAEKIYQIIQGLYDKLSLVLNSD